MLTVMSDRNGKPSPIWAAKINILFPSRQRETRKEFSRLITLKGKGKEKGINQSSHNPETNEPD